jgi:hypothetical protein
MPDQKRKKAKPLPAVVEREPDLVRKLAEALVVGLGVANETRGGLWAGKPPASYVDGLMDVCATQLKALERAGYRIVRVLVTEE